MQTRETDHDLLMRITAGFLGEFPCSIVEQTGGLSSSRVWRVDAARGTFALRQNPPEFPTRNRLQWLHELLKKVRAAGSNRLPCPVATRDGATWLEFAEHRWELLDWHHGEPLLETSPTRELLIKAVVALADLHRTLSNIDRKPVLSQDLRQAIVPGLQQRSELLHQWNAGVEQQINVCLAEHREFAQFRGLFELLRESIKRHQQPLLDLLTRACSSSVPLFPVLRDAQPAHFIFAAAELTGIIDVGAMRVDSPMADLARLLQRWQNTEPTWYDDALRAYQKIRPLEQGEQVVLDAYNNSARLLTGVQWLKWLVLERRVFDNHALVKQHLERVIRELKFLPEHAFRSD